MVFSARSIMDRGQSIGEIRVICGRVRVIIYMARGLSLFYGRSIGEIGVIHGHIQVIVYRLSVTNRDSGTSEARDRGKVT